MRGSLKLLPNAYKQQQFVVVGDQDGVLQVFSSKKNDIQIQFKTLPTDKITMIQLGGATSSGIFNYACLIERFFKYILKDHWVIKFLLQWKIK